MRSKTECSKICLKMAGLYNNKSEIDSRLEKSPEKLKPFSIHRRN